MTKKILLGLGALGITLAVLPMFAAFEAHVVNVTATIENALQVTSKALGFGTVFPQEHLIKPLSVELSDSFLVEDRVDDVNYFIRQKPKCGVTTNDGTVLVGPTATGHVSLDAVDRLIIDCGPDPRPVDEAGHRLPLGSTWDVLPSLCPYISKEPDGNPQPGNDGSLASFHNPFSIVGHQIVWNDTLGHLTKGGNDTVDNWTIDLDVPCFRGQCAQDWTHQGWELDPTQEHKVFGCDLWVEVNGISPARE